MTWITSPAIAARRAAERAADRERYAQRVQQLLSEVVAARKAAKPVERKSSPRAQKREAIAADLKQYPDMPPNQIARLHDVNTETVRRIRRTLPPDVQPHQPLPVNPRLSAALRHGEHLIDSGAIEATPERGSREWHTQIETGVACKPLRNTYGLTAEQLGAMYDAQGGCCAICHRAFGIGRRACIDHCHQSGKVRGLLCSPCNTGIGGLGDDVERLESARRYLLRSQQAPLANK